MASVEVVTRLARPVTCVAFLIATLTADTLAQAPSSQAPTKVVLTANPLGFLQFGPTVEAEALAGRTRFVTGSAFQRSAFSLT